MKLVCVVFISKNVAWLSTLVLFCASLRRNPTRWTRRTRPTPWCQWLHCPRSRSISPPLTASPRQKMEPAPPRQLTDTLLARPRWPTPRCESENKYVGTGVGNPRAWPPTTPTTHQDTLPTSPPLLFQRLPTQWDQISTNPPDTHSFPSWAWIQPANVQTTMTTVNLGTAIKKSDVPAMWSFCFLFLIVHGFCSCQERQFKRCVGILVPIFVRLQRNAKKKNMCRKYQMKEHVVLFQPTMTTWNRKTSWWSLPFFFVCNSRCFVTSVALTMFKKKKEKWKKKMKSLPTLGTFF